MFTFMSSFDMSYENYLVQDDNDDDNLHLMIVGIAILLITSIYGVFCGFDDPETKMCREWMSLDVIR